MTLTRASWLLGVVGVSLLSLVVLYPLSATRAAEPFILGAWYNAPDLEGQTLEQFEQSLGVFFNAHKRYLNWDQAMDTAFAQQVHAQGRIPEITWQPWINGVGVPFGDIAAGTYDAYITQFAQAVKALPFSIQLTLAAEMNGWWSPWAINGEPGRTNQDFIAGWRRVHGIFQSVGATNVSWIWAPNVVQPSSPVTYSFAELYPGHAYVTYLGLDGYNFGTYFHPDGWETFREVFEYSYTLLGQISTKSILIMEVASNENGGDKAAWIKDMFAQLPNFPRIRGFTWFNRIRETDWRIASSPASKQAFKEGAALFFQVQPTPSPNPTVGSTKTTPAPTTPPAQTGAQDQTTEPVEPNELSPTTKNPAEIASAEQATPLPGQTDSTSPTSSSTNLPAGGAHPPIPVSWWDQLLLAWGALVLLTLLKLGRPARSKPSSPPELQINFTE